MVIAKHETVAWKAVDKLDNSLRGDKGFEVLANNI